MAETNELSLNSVVWLTTPGTMKLKGLIKETERNSVNYQDFVGITALLIINSTISFIEENNTGNAAAAVMARLAPKANQFLDFHLEDKVSFEPGVLTDHQGHVYS